MRGKEQQSSIRLVCAVSPGKPVQKLCSHTGRWCADVTLFFVKRFLFFTDRLEYCLPMRAANASRQVVGL